MKKNYEKLYKKLKRMMKDDLKMSNKYLKTLNYWEHLRDKIEIEGQREQLKWFLNEYIPELEGKKWNNICLNETEFEEWKKEINLTGEDS